MVDGPKLPFRQTFPRDMTELPTILQNMEKARIDLRILSLTNPMVYWAPDSFSMKLSQTFNDACSAACQAHPTKLRGAIMLPMQAPRLAIEELERAARLARHVLRLHGAARQRREPRRPLVLAGLRALRRPQAAALPASRGAVRQGADGQVSSLQPHR